MKSTHSPRVWLWLGTLVILAASYGCTKTDGSALLPTTNITQAVQQTLQARLPTPTPGATDPAIPTPPSHQTATQTVPPTPGAATNTRPVALQISPSPEPTQVCDRAAPGYPKLDVSIEDGTEMDPGQEFTKVWRLTNSGLCTWTTAYDIVFAYGDQMEASEAISLSDEIYQGEALEISVDMVAPEQAGTYRGNWKLRNAEGELFGIGPDGDASFWVQIVVVAPASPTPTPTEIPSATPSATVAITATPTETSTFTPTPLVQTRGMVMLTPGDLLDADTLKINTDAGIDLQYLSDEASTHWLVPQNGTLLGFYGNAEPGLSDCLAANMSAAPIPMESIPANTYLCARTNTGWPAWVLVKSINPDNASLDLDILTWAVK